MPASHVGLPLSLSLIGSGHLTSCSDMKRVRLRRYVGRSRSQAEEESGLLKNLGLSSSRRIFVIIALCVHLPGCATASRAVLIRFMVMSMEG